MTAISISNLRVTAGSIPLLHDVSLEFAPGQWHTVVGPNGAGKTTLVEATAGVRRRAAGSIQIDGRDVATMSERERAQSLAFVPQHPVVPAGMTVRDYVGLGRTAYRGLLRGPSAKDRDVVAEVLERVEITAFAERDVITLSGGERQRMVLARALAQHTMVVILDEPITGLDIRHQVDLLEVLRREVQECGITVIATLHDLTLAAQFADQMVLLANGAVQTQGVPHDVLHSPQLQTSYEVELQVVSVGGSDVVVPVSSVR